MTLEVETVVAVSLMMAVFSAVAAVGTSVVLGAGFERLRAGFDIVSKQTGFFSDAIHKLENKVEIVDKQANNFSHTISTLEAKVTNVGEQAGAFTACVQKLEQKVEIVNKQSGFFSDSLYQLEQKIDSLDEQEKRIAEKMERITDTPDLISAGMDDASASSQNLLMEMASLTAAPEYYGEAAEALSQETHFHIPQSLSINIVESNGKAISYH